MHLSLQVIIIYLWLWGGYCSPSLCDAAAHCLNCYCHLYHYQNKQLLKIGCQRKCKSVEERKTSSVLAFVLGSTSSWGKYPVLQPLNAPPCSPAGLLLGLSAVCCWAGGGQWLYQNFYFENTETDTNRKKTKLGAKRGWKGPQSCRDRENSGNFTSNGIDRSIVKKKMRISRDPATVAWCGSLCVCVCVCVPDLRPLLDSEAVNAAVQQSDWQQAGEQQTATELHLKWRQHID